MINIILITFYLELIKIIYLQKNNLMNKTIAVSLVVLGAVFANAQQKKDTVKREVKIDEVELFGEKNKQPEGLEVITS
jgi:iron complex outermembrane receptor protein